MPTYSWTVQPVPTAPPTGAAVPSGAPATAFGTDVSTFPDLDPTFTAQTAPGRVLGEAIARRLVTPRGTLPGDPAYGYDVRALLNEASTVGGQAALKAGITAECLKDERVDGVTVDVSYDQARQSLSLKLLVDTAAGPFALTLAVSALTIDLLSV